MKRNVAALLAGAMLMFSASMAMATPITGTVDFTGNFTTDTGVNLATASEVIFGTVFLNNVLVPPTGSFAPLATDASPPATVTYSNLVFNPSTAESPLWTLTYNGITYSFNIDTVSVVTQTSSPFQYLSLAGEGMLSITGYDPTPGTWTFSSNGTNGSTIGFTAESAVPEPGTMMLLGIGMLGLAVYGKRRLNKEA
jgi:hypothetical protein